ncbi:G-type lectin S-receptor-like serine/threonine-protein kinase [Tanacetum coccineum]
MTLPTPNRPAFFIGRVDAKSTSGESKEKDCSMNNMTISVVQGRYDTETFERGVVIGETETVACAHRGYTCYKDRVGNKNPYHYIVATARYAPSFSQYVLCLKKRAS